MGQVKQNWPLLSVAQGLDLHGASEKEKSLALKENLLVLDN